MKRSAIPYREGTFSGELESTRHRFPQLPSAKSRQGKPSLWGKYLEGGVGVLEDEASTMVVAVAAKATMAATGAAWVVDAAELPALPMPTLSRHSCRHRVEISEGNVCVVTWALSAGLSCSSGLRLRGMQHWQWYPMISVRCIHGCVVLAIPANCDNKSDEHVVGEHGRDT